MRKITLTLLTTLLALAVVAGCTSSSMTGSQTSSTQNRQGGTETLKAKKASGSSTVDIEIENDGGQILRALVSVYVETGSFKVELLGDDDFVTGSIEARDGQTASGEGFMTIDTFGEASYRWTAEEATNVDMYMEYVFE